MSGKEVRPVVRCLLFSSALCCLEETESASLFCSTSTSVRCIATPQWMEFFPGIDFAGISNKQLALSLVRRRPSRSFLVLAAAEVVVVRRGRRGWLESADRARAHSRWSSSGYGAGACNRGRWPVVAGMPPYFLAEGRLSSFLLAMEPLGRQSSCWSKAMASGHGSLVAPSGEVPGDGEVLDHIGDAGLKVVASCCLVLQELRVFPANANVLASTGVTEEGLVAVSSGCRKLNSVLCSCSRMTNSALITVAKNCSRITSFRLRICLHGSADAVTGQPLDEGFRAIVRSCKGLRRLSMSGLLTDSAFLYIGMYAERLETLYVAFAGDSDDGMTYVLNGCKILRKLEIRNCPFGDTALLAGMHRYEAMCSLWMLSCDITLGGCRSLAANMPGLNVEVSSEEANIDASDAKKVEKLYVYRTLAGPRGDAPGFVSAL